MRADYCRLEKCKFMCTFMPPQAMIRQAKTGGVVGMPLVECEDKQYLWAWCDVKGCPQIML